MKRGGAPAGRDTSEASICLALLLAHDAEDTGGNHAEGA